MASETLEFDLLARDGASKAFDALARSALKADAEIRAAFADPVDVKVDSRGWDEYIGKVQAAKLANEDMISRTSRLTLEAEKASRELDNLFTSLDPKAGGGGGRGLFSRMLGGLGDSGGLLAKLTGGNLAMGAGGLAAGAGIAGLGGILSGAVGGLGAGGILGGSIFGAIQGYTQLATKISTLKTSLEGMKPGTKSYIADQEKLNLLLQKQHAQYGPMVAGLHDVSGAWDKFMGATRGPTQRLLGEGLKIAADALRQFAPVANAAARALMPLAKEMDRWVQGPDFRKMLDYFGTTGVHALAGFVKFLFETTGALIRMGEAMAPAAAAVGKLLSHLNGAGDLALLGSVLGGIAAVMLGISGPVVAVVAGIVALGVAIDAAYVHSAKFRAAVTQAFDKVKASLSDLVTAAEGFWAKWGSDIKKFGLGYLVLTVRQIGDVLAGLAHVLAAVLDVLTGNWSGAWRQMKRAASAIWDGIRAELVIFAHALEPIVSSALRSVESATVSAWNAINNAFAHGAQSAVSFVASLPGKIVGALAALPGQMVAIGGHIIGGLIAGLESKAGDLAGTLGHIASSIPSKLMGFLGINSPAKKTIPIGEAVIKGIEVGLKNRRKHLEAELSQVEKAVAAITAKITAAQQFGAAFMGNPFADVSATRNVTTVKPGGVMTQLINGQIVTTHGPSTSTTKTVPLTNKQLIANMLHDERKQRNTAHTLAEEMKKLEHEGISKSLVEQMEAAGPAGLAQIKALASATKHQVHEFNALNAQATKSYNNAGAIGLEGTTMAHLHRRQQNKQDMEAAIKHALKGVQLQISHTKLRVVG